MKNMKDMVSSVKSVITSKTAAVTAFLLAAPAMAFAQDLPASASGMMTTGEAWLVAIGVGVAALALASLGIAAVVGIARVVKGFVFSPA